MREENLMESDQDYIDNMDLREAIEVFRAYIKAVEPMENEVDKKAFEIILETIELDIEFYEIIKRIYRLIPDKGKR